MVRNMKRVFTVFTATYNRAHTLHRVYKSLVQQTFRDFEWLIVDDGSADGTEHLVKNWIIEAKFPIRYIYQKNKGKHVAFNNGVGLAEGEFFLSLDSDDSCTSDALQVFFDTWNSIPERKRSEFSGVCSLVMDETGRIVGKPFPSDILDAPSTEIHRKFHVTGEKWGFQRTDVLRDFPFPELSGEKYVPESIVWNRISKKYKERFINRMLRTYYNPITSSDQLTTSPVWKNSNAILLGHICALNEQIEWIHYDPVFFFKAASNVSRIARHAGVKLREQWRRLENFQARTLWFIGLPVGCLLYARDRYRRIKIENSQSR